MTDNVPLNFTNAKRDCDVVLKGGVTSGIVYPMALCELATDFVFRRLGGTSSGAIVAAFAAAAEYWRQAERETQNPPTVAKRKQGLRPGFRGMEDFAKELQTGDKLFSVFKPDAATKPIFDVLFAAHREEARKRRANEEERSTSGAAENDRDKGSRRRATQPVLRTLVTLWSHVPKGPPIIGASIGLAAIIGVGWPLIARIGPLVHGGWQARVIGDGLALLFVAMIVACVLVGALVGAIISTTAMIRDNWIPTFVANGFGLTRGLAPPTGGAASRDGAEDGEEPYSLTTWMTRIINELAARDPLDAPLTLGDLWRVNGGSETAKTIQFETITTCLTLGRPLHLPDDLRPKNDRVTCGVEHARECPAAPPFYFDPDEWRQYFPVRVVKWLKDHSTEPGRTRLPNAKVGSVYYRLPPAEFLPLVVITRLSVALPVVLSAVPLWSVDLNTKGARDPDKMPLERAWFSDGGIGSNFPIHFFDALIPNWPTFGIDLRDANRAYPLVRNEDDNVWMPLTNEQGRTEWWKRFETDAPGADANPNAAIKSAVQFGMSIVNTSLTWRDTMLAREAGFRDRIAHIKLDPENEGGLNLDMPTEVIARLIRRGAAAGRLLRTRYTISQDELDELNQRKRDSLTTTEAELWSPTTVSWENHRWVRFRASMAALQEALEAMNDAYNREPGYEALVGRDPGMAPRDYQWSDTQRAADPVVKTRALLNALHTWRADPEIRFNGGSLPIQRPELRMSPRV
jgi:predicted acylesterase/phospholipase RssA